MSRPAVFLLLIPCLLAGGVGQQPIAEQEPYLGTLVRKADVPLPGTYDVGFTGRVQCDPDGNVYARQVTMGWRDPILKFQPDGKLTRFSLSDVTVKRLQPRGGGLAYFVGGDGDVHQIAQVPRTYEIYVVTWKKDGSFRSATPLDARFTPYGPLAVFPSGEIVVSGFAPHDSDLPRDTPMTILFDKNGRVVKELVLEGDAFEEAHLEASEEEQQESRKQKTMAVSLGGAVIGSDGNLYLMRRSLPARVAVISPSGELVRTLAIESGDPKLLPASLVEREGKLATIFYNYFDPETVLVIADAQTGWALERYEVERAVGRSLACYEKEGFTFFSVRGRNIGLLRAGPL